jgi:dipeptidase E
MPKLYLLGGENVYKRSAKKVNERAFQDVREHPVVAVFSWARASFDKDYKKRKLLADYFISLGASTIDFIEYSDSKENIAQRIATSDLIYLTGGLATALVERLINMEVDSLLLNYSGVIVGRSAGALVLCRKYIITCRSNSKNKIIDGLGLANLTLKVHYNPEKNSALERLSFQDKIYAVPMGSALIYENGDLSFINKVYLFNDGKRQILS